MHGGPIVRQLESLPVPRPKRIPPWWANRFGGPVRTTKWADD
jgi:hypothetical protein